MSVWISLEPTEPLLLRGHGEFDPMARGPVLSAESLVWPRPTTVAGALASILYRGQTGIVKDWKEDLRFMARILNHAGIEAIRGPLLEFEDKIWVPLNDGKKLHIVPYESLEKIYNILISDTKKEKKELTELEITPVQRIGIGLEVRSRGSKTVREGLLYSATFVAFPQGSKFLYKLVGDVKALPSGPLKLGGEQRIVHLQVEDFELCWNKCKRLVFLSPLPTNRKVPLAMGRIDVIGLGFSTKLRKRRPLVRAVMEGSVLECDVELECDGEVDFDTISDIVSDYMDPENREILKTLGFGSAIPF